MLRKFWAKIRTSLYQRKLKSTDRKDIFTEYYRKNFWSNSESFSGSGSTLEYTANLRAEMPGLLTQLKAETMLDAPCGDFNWFRHMDRGGVSYTGGDIVPDLIARNNELYRDDLTKFIELDIINGPLPATDVWLCRDALFHFSNADVLKTLQNFVESDIKYLLTSSHSDHRENTDILTGDFRLMNLELPPFNLPKPQIAIDDWIEGFPVRHIGVWDRETIRQVLTR